MPSFRNKLYRYSGLGLMSLLKQGGDIKRISLPCAICAFLVAEIRLVGAKIFRAHIHMAKNLPTNNQRTLNEYSTKIFSSSCIRRRRMFDFNFHYFNSFLRKQVHIPKK